MSSVTEERFNNSFIKFENVSLSYLLTNYGSYQLGCTDLEKFICLKRNDVADPFHERVIQSCPEYD